METSKSTGKLRKPRRRRLYVYLMDDNHNSIEFVIKVLMTICHHNVYQAEQCAMITHMNGRSLIYSGLGEDPIIVFEQLLKHGITVELKSKKV